MKKKSLIIALIVFFYDQLIKWIINGSFYYGKLVTIIPRTVYLTKVYNDGAAWSTFSGSRIFLIIIALIAFVCLYKYIDNFQNNRRNNIAYGLVFGGLLGNLFDRIFYGHVIDYLKIYIGNYEFPIFNFADVALVIGFILIIFAIYKGEDKNGSKSRSK